MGSQLIGGKLFMSKTSEELLEIVVRAADQLKAKDIIAIDMRGLSILTDFNVITHASNNRLINAIAEAVADASEKAGVPVKNIEGKQGGTWTLIDLGDVIFHVFDEEERSHYKLENLWTEAPTMDLSEWIIEE